MAREFGEKEVVFISVTEIKDKGSKWIMNIVNDESKLVMLRTKWGDIKLSPVKYS